MNPMLNEFNVLIIKKIAVKTLLLTHTCLYSYLLDLIDLLFIYLVVEVLVKLQYVMITENL